MNLGLCLVNCCLGRFAMLVAVAQLWFWNWVCFACVAWPLSALTVLNSWGLARVFQGLGAAGPKIVCRAVVRDGFEDAAMARVMSLIYTVLYWSR